MAELQQPLLPSDSDSSDHQSIQSSITSETPPKPSIIEALTYIQIVKNSLRDNVPTYTEFLDVMKDYKRKRTDIWGVMSRIQEIFKDHPELITGFNTFLPAGYKISIPPQNKPLEFDDAINFVQKVKDQLPSDNGTYIAFLDILNEYKNNNKSTIMVYQEVSSLFRDKPVLLEDFQRFLPNTSKSPSAKKVRRRKRADRSVNTVFMLSCLVNFFLLLYLIAYFGMGFRFRI